MPTNAAEKNNKSDNLLIREVRDVVIYKISMDVFF